MNFLNVCLRRGVGTCAIILFVLLQAGNLAPAAAQTVVWSWGNNFYGQLGSGTLNRLPSPVKVNTLASVSGTSAGFRYTLALRADGTVWAWGANEYGQLGNGSLTNADSPVQVPGLTNIKAVAAGGLHGLALKSDGTVLAWGINADGELGIGTHTDSHVPVQVSGLTNVVAIAGGAIHSLALRSDGTVWAWGHNDLGQLGDGTTTSRAVPVQVKNLTSIVAIAGKGDGHSLALRSDGTVWAWGANNLGQIGDGTTVNRLAPVQVPGLSGVTAVACGASHSLALRADGTIAAWGCNYSGQLGDGTLINRYRPITVAALAGVTSIAARGDHSLALIRADGSVRAWGDNSSGEIGNGGFYNQSRPAPVAGLAGMASVDCGPFHSIAIRKSDGSVWTWGSNSNGQLGAGAFGDSNFPEEVDGIGGVAAIALASANGLALTQSDGKVWSWGDNSFGQLGDGTLNLHTSPVQVSGLTGMSAIAGGGAYNLALHRSGGTVWAWGRNDNGQLGDGTSSNRPSPVRVTGLSGITAIATEAGGHSLAIDAAGSVWAWGYNSDGQLGDGTTTTRTTAVAVKNLTGVSAIACGEKHSLAIRKSDGTVWAWGLNTSGQLGDATTTSHSAPVELFSLGGVTSVACGALHSLALMPDGTVRAWGHNYDGELGDGTTTDRHSPVKVKGLTGVVAIAAGEWYSVALRSDGTVWTWGYNYDGELGNNTNTDRHIPVQVAGLANIQSIAAGGYTSLALQKVAISTSLTIQAGTASIGAQFHCQATLKRTDTGATVSGQPVLFTVDGSAIGAVVTNAQGIASLSFVIPNSVKPGAHTLYADFGGDVNLGASQNSLPVTVAKGSVVITVPAVSGSAGSQVTLKATARNSSGAALANVTINFAVAGTGVGSAVTNAAGQASLAYTIPTGTASGNRAIVARFSGNTGYNTGAGSGTLTIP